MHLYSIPSDVHVIVQNEVHDLMERLVWMAGCRDEATLIATIADNQLIDRPIELLAVGSNNRDEAHAITQRLLHDGCQWGLADGL